MRRMIYAISFIVCLLVSSVIVCTCNRKESICPKTTTAGPSVIEYALTSQTYSTHSEHIRTEGVAISGIITAADGTALPFCTLNSQARDVSGRPVDREPVTTMVTMDEDGSYAVSNLSLSYYTFSVEAEGYSPYVTNILLTALDTRVDFFFPAITNIHVTGSVIIAETQETAERVPVILTTTAGGEQKQTVKTDDNGRFSFQAPAIVGIPIGTLSVEEPGYVPITCNLEARYRSQEIDLYLKRSGVIKGVVRTTDGVPVKGVTVIARHDQRGQSKYRNSAALFPHKESIKWEIESIKACNFSDENGAYSISNVPTPGEYSIDIESEVYVLASPFSIKNHNDEKIVQIYVTDNRTIICNVSVEPKKVIMIRLLDENRDPVSPYILTIIKGGNYVVRDKKINTTNWISINIEKLYTSRQPERSMRIRADYWDGRYAEGSNVISQVGITNQVELILSTGMFYVSGTICYPDATPASDVEVYAGKERVFSDAAGYFAIYGSTVSQNTQLVVKAHTEKYFFRLSTNILVGTENVELTLNALRQVKGRVLCGIPPKPATDFQIKRGKHYFNIYDPMDGRFIYLIPDKSDKGMLYLLVPGYESREITYDFSTNCICDLGDILFTNAPAGIKGKVIDQNGSPLPVNIVLCYAGKPKPDWFQTQGSDSNPKDGSFIVADLSPGSYYLNISMLNSNREYLEIKSDIIRLTKGEIKELPPIVITVSNTMIRCLTFILPDGKPAAFATIDFALKYTDDRGQISLPILAGRYAGVNVTFGKESYISEPFEIEEDTIERTIQLLPETIMTVTVTCDGEPLASGWLKLHARNTLSSYSCKVTEGTFEAYVPAGEYIAVDYSKHVFANVDLEPEQENTIAFETGNGSMRIPYPFSDKWGSIRASIHIDGRYVFCGMASTRGNEEYIDMKNMPSGQYRINIKPRHDSTNTSSYTIETTLGEDEQKTLVLKQK